MSWNKEHKECWISYKWQRRNDDIISVSAAYSTSLVIATIKVYDISNDRILTVKKTNGQLIDGCYYDSERRRT